MKDGIRQLGSDREAVQDHRDMQYLKLNHQVHAERWSPTYPARDHVS